MTPLSQQSQPSDERALLDLPPELRNTIYRLVLVKSPYIFIHHSQAPPQEPGLLSTSRQIRDEARDIYYKENTFAFAIHDFDATILLAFGNRSTAHRESKRAVVMSGSPNWTNLKAWLKAAFDGRCYQIQRDDPNVDGPRSDLCEHFAIMCFGVAGKLQSQGLCWADVESVLEDLHYGMGAADPAWK